MKLAFRLSPSDPGSSTYTPQAPLLLLIPASKLLHREKDHEHVTANSAPPGLRNEVSQRMLPEDMDSLAPSPERTVAFTVEFVISMDVCTSLSPETGRFHFELLIS